MVTLLLLFGYSFVKISQDDPAGEVYLCSLSVESNSSLDTFLISPTITWGYKEGFGICLAGDFDSTDVQYTIVPYFGYEDSLNNNDWINLVSIGKPSGWKKYESDFYPPFGFSIMFRIIELKDMNRSMKFFLYKRR